MVSVQLDTVSEPKIVVYKEEVVPANEKGILKRAQIAFTLEEYQLLRSAIATIDHFLIFNSLTEQANDNLKK